MEKILFQSIRPMILLSFLLVLLPPCCNADFAHRPAVQEFIVQMHQKHGLNQAHLQSLFQKFSANQKVLALMDKQTEALPWYQYRARVINEKRIAAGALFWKKHQQTLKKIHKEFGIPPEIIVSILGIETSYGNVMGHYPLVESLATLAFNYPRRAAFFKKELEQLLLLDQEGALDLHTALGSYAGAIGMPQFMPSNYRRYAIDFSGKGKRDLIHNPEDVLGSVAHYLKKHGWQSNQKIVSKRKPFNLKKEKLITLQHSDNKKIHYTGLQNFKVIMRYNNSVHYAMAVYELSREIRKVYKS